MSDSQEPTKGLGFFMPSGDNRKMFDTILITVPVDKADWYLDINDLFEKYESKAIEIWKAEMKKDANE